ncbi:MAG: hypothetical protein AAGN66_07910 [Acidobacteriota bacterium]
MTSPIDLDARALARLVQRVFEPTSEDRRLAILIDLPDSAVPDHDVWRDRRSLAAEWAAAFAADPDALDMEVSFVAYPNARTNNGDLPDHAWILPCGGPAPSHLEHLDRAEAVGFDSIFSTHQILLAVTELSATAPMKLQAPRFGFRAATMPGFRRVMIPALRLDYVEVDRRCRHLKDLLDHAEGAAVHFSVGGRTHRLDLDLRHRTGHASGGLVRGTGTAGNLPSGETYIVPYEGEVDGDPSRTRGELPVELDGEVVVYRIEENRAVEVLPHGDSEGDVPQREAEWIAAEPGYANLAELGLGVLSDFGVEPVGAILLDEKLGLHIAFGRSDHFGGQVGAEDFSSPDAVVHIDRVYLPATQPRVQVDGVDLAMPGGEALALMRNYRYTIEFE